MDLATIAIMVIAAATAGVMFYAVEKLSEA